MSKKIFKYSLLGVETEIEMPSGAVILHAGHQMGIVTIWALVDPEKPNVTHRLSFYGTGHEMPTDMKGMAYIGTIHIGDFVWHLFDHGEVLK